MIDEHGLISVGASLRENLPGGAKLFIDVNDTLCRVKKIIATKRGLRAIVNNHRLPTNENDVLVISYYDLSGEVTSTVIKNSHVASLPLKRIPQLEYAEPSYAGIHCG
jgi:hypothetical protein